MSTCPSNWMLVLRQGCRTCYPMPGWFLSSVLRKTLGISLKGCSAAISAYKYQFAPERSRKGHWIRILVGSGAISCRNLPGESHESGRNRDHGRIAEPRMQAAMPIGGSRLTPRAFIGRGKCRGHPSRSLRRLPADEPDPASRTPRLAHGAARRGPRPESWASRRTSWVDDLQGPW